MSVPLLRNVKLHRALAAVLPWASTLAFYGALVALPLLPLLSEKTGVAENSYLHGFTPDSLTNIERYFMVDAFTSLKEACVRGSERANEETRDLEAFSHWTSNAPADMPEVYKQVGELAREYIPRAEVAYNDFRYVFGTGLGVTGSSVLLRLKCARCSSRGASLVVVNIDTGSKSAFAMDAKGNVFKPKGGDTDGHRRCTSSATGAAVALAALRAMAHFDNQAQDLIVLITERNLPYAAGTRQFLDDYFGRAHFKWHSGWLHHAVALDLGYGRCSRYEVSYEGLDGAVPNQDVLTSFLATAESLELDAAPAGLWEHVGRMALNARPHLPHVALLARNISSFTLTCAKPAAPAEENTAEKLLRALAVTMRMHNNVETVLERSSNLYQLVSRDRILPASAYAPIIPALLLGPTVDLAYSTYTWDFHVLVAALCLFSVNSFLGTWLSYRYLLKAASSSFDSLDEANLSRVRVALALLLIGAVVVAALNVLLFKVLLPRRAYEGFVPGRRVVERSELLSKLGYSVEPATIFASVFTRIFGLFDALLARMGGVRCRLLCVPSEAGEMSTRRRRTSLRIATAIEKWRQRFSKPKLATPPSEADWEQDKGEGEAPAEETPTSEPAVDEAECRRQLDAMGGTLVLFPTNVGLPSGQVLTGIGLIYFVLVFLYSLMIIHWQLALVMTLCSLPVLGAVRLRGQSPGATFLYSVLCTGYAAVPLLLWLAPWPLSELQLELVNTLVMSGPFGVLRAIVRLLHDLWACVQGHSLAELREKMRTPFFAQTVFAISQQHALLVSQGQLRAMLFIGGTIANAFAAFVLTRLSTPAPHSA